MPALARDAMLSAQFAMWQMSDQAFNETCSTGKRLNT
jgi:hypothetical protein